MGISETHELEFSEFPDFDQWFVTEYVPLAGGWQY